MNTVIPFRVGGNLSQATFVAFGLLIIVAAIAGSNTLLQLWSANSANGSSGRAAVVELTCAPHFWWPDAGPGAEFSLKLAAKSNQRDVILGVTTSCGCATATVPNSEILPNKEVTIPVVVNVAGRNGVHRFHVIVKREIAGDEQYVFNVPCYPSGMFVPAEFGESDEVTVPRDGFILLRGKDPALIPVIKEMSSDGGIAVLDKGCETASGVVENGVVEVKHRFSWQWASEEQTTGRAIVVATVFDPRDGKLHRISCPIRRPAAVLYVVDPPRVFIRTSDSQDTAFERSVEISRCDGSEFEVLDVDSSHSGITAKAQSHGPRVKHRLLAQCAPMAFKTTATAASLNIRCRSIQGKSESIELPVSLLVVR